MKQVFRFSNCKIGDISYEKEMFFFCKNYVLNIMENRIDISYKIYSTLADCIVAAGYSVMYDRPDIEKIMYLDSIKRLLLANKNLDYWKENNNVVEITLWETARNNAINDLKEVLERTELFSILENAEYGDSAVQALEEIKKAIKGEGSAQEYLDKDMFVSIDITEDITKAIQFKRASLEEEFFKAVSKTPSYEVIDIIK